jgi:hypothetical protein
MLSDDYQTYYENYYHDSRLLEFIDVPYDPALRDSENIRES